MHKINFTNFKKQADDILRKKSSETLNEFLPQSNVQNACEITIQFQFFNISCLFSLFVLYLL